MTEEIKHTKVVEVAKLVAGPITLQAVRAEDSDGTEYPMTFRMTLGDKVLAEMGEEYARLFVDQVRATFIQEYDSEWTRLPTYAAVEADRQKLAARNAA